MTTSTSNMSPPHTRDAWAQRTNTREIDGADEMLSSSRVMDRCLRAICRVDFPDVIEVPDEGPIVFAANHRSFLDIAVAMGIFGRLSVTCRMQVRADMFERPVIGKWLKRIRCIPTNKATRTEAEATAIETLTAGSTVAIMPEGRLVPPKDRPGGVGEARTGVSRIVRQTDAWVIPVAIHGSDAIWPKGRPIPKLGVFRRRDLVVRLGSPMKFDDTDHQTNADNLMSTIAGILTEIEADLASRA